MPRKYTVEVHAERLEQMLVLGNVCYKCPGAPRFQTGVGFCSGLERSEVCKICQEFVGLTPYVRGRCPCARLGSEEAIQRSWEALNQFKERKEEVG